MASWQKRARLGVALFGIVTSVGVYFAIGERRKPKAPAVASQLPPDVVLESIGGQLERLRGLKQEYSVKFGRSRTFSDGSSEIEDTVIEANRDGRRFVVSARLARVTKGNRDITLRDSVHLREDDGFEMRTAAATFNEDTGLIRATGPVTFNKGRMSGSGTGMTYDEPADILHIERDARVNVAGDKNQKPVAFNSGAATLDRARNLLILRGAVHALHGEQETDAKEATARLSENEDLIQFVELRGNARVAGGLGSVSSLNARDIDLDYADDGRTLERASLRGGSQIRMNGTGDGAAGRSVSGERLDVSMRADGSLDRLTGSGGVAMTLPPAKDAPGRTVQASTLEAQAGADGALNSARFAQNVRFEEEAGEGGRRTATSDTLSLDLSDAAISKAFFQGNARFTDGDLLGTAAQANYDPKSSRLELRGRDTRGEPAVRDSRVTIEAESVDIQLGARSIAAQGGVKSTLLSTKDQKTGDAGKTTQMPGLLKQDQPAIVTADSVTYEADAGVAVYTGRAWLSQGDAGKGDTRIRAQSIELQQKAGDLIARGKVQTKFIFDDGRLSEGESDEFRYLDAKRTMTYLAQAVESDARTVPTAHVTGPQGDLRGRRVTAFLAASESRLEQLEAQDDVIAKVDGRTARGNALKYQVRDESYEIRGTSLVPASVEVTTAAEGCRQAKGRTLTFNRSADTMDVRDGQRERRTLWQQCR